MHYDLGHFHTEKFLLIPLNRTQYRLFKVEIWVLCPLGETTLVDPAYGLHLGVEDLERCRMGPLPLRSRVGVETHGGALMMM